MQSPSNKKVGSETGPRLIAPFLLTLQFRKHRVNGSDTVGYNYEMVLVEEQISENDARRFLREFVSHKASLDLTDEIIRQTRTAVELIRVDDGEDIQLLCDCIKPLSGEWIWYKDELAEARTRWTIQQRFLSLVPAFLNPLLRVDAEKHPQVFQYILAYSLDGYPWVKNNGVLSRSKEWLNANWEHFPGFNKLIEDIIKPAFLKSASHPSISDAGRRNIVNDNGPEGRRSGRLNPAFDSEVSESRAPWREFDQSVIALLEAAIRDLSDGKLKNLWPFLVPSVLNIADDHEALIKRKGCLFIEILLEKMDSRFLHTTGLIPVFQEAVTPIFHFIPPSIDVQLSVELLRQGTSTILAISRVYELNSKNTDRLAVLDSLMFDVLHALSNSGQKIEMVVTVLQLLEIVVADLKSETVKYLQELVKVYSNVLGDPFIAQSPVLLFQCTHMMNTVISYCWPRIGRYRYEVLRGAILAYRQVLKIESEDKAAMVDSLCLLVQKLKDAVQDHSIGEDIGRLTAADESLNGLFNRDY